MWGKKIGSGDFHDVRHQYRENEDDKTERLFIECRNPVRIPVLTDTGNETNVLSYGRCRKCAGCMRYRQYVWANRAELEYELSERTWWVTLTYRGTWEPSYEDVKKYLKRLRKQHSFRYVISEERGDQNERIHWHLLLHCSNSLKRRQLEKGWNGFVHPRLAKTAGLGGYLAKYLAKQSRIRASKHYGKFEYFYSKLSERSQERVETFIRTGKEDDGVTYAGIGVKPWGITVNVEQFRWWKRITGYSSGNIDLDASWEGVPF